MIQNLILHLINYDRYKQGLNFLTIDKQLIRIAFRYSQRMALEDFFSHDDPQGRSLKDKIGNYQYLMIGENLAMIPLLNNNARKSDQELAIETHDALMKSRGHRKNILLKDYNKIGLGVSFNSSYLYLTELFSQVSY